MRSGHDTLGAGSPGSPCWKPVSGFDPRGEAHSSSSPPTESRPKPRHPASPQAIIVRDNDSRFGEPFDEALTEQSIGAEVLLVRLPCDIRHAQSNSGLKSGSTQLSRTSNGGRSSSSSKITASFSNWPIDSAMIHFSKPSASE